MGDAGGIGFQIRDVGGDGALGGAEDVGEAGHGGPGVEGRRNGACLDHGGCALDGGDEITDFRGAEDDDFRAAIRHKGDVPGELDGVA